MSATVKQPVAIACLFTWIGFVCAISFLEAWLKFRAPGVSLPVGLGIGRLVFGALNKTEWVFALVTSVSAFLYSRSFFTAPNVLLLVIVTILALQSLWLLPALDARAELYIQDKPVPESSLHLWFVGLELVKVIILLITGISLFKQT